MIKDLQLSQASLQDYVDCHRRFYLRHVLKINWPGHETDQAVKQASRARSGSAFHRLVHQQRIGIPEDLLADAASEGQLMRWWRNYKERPIRDLDGKKHAELSLSMPLADIRLIAKYDLVSVGTRTTIVDWKTSKPRSEVWLQARMQSRVYPYVMAMAGKAVNAEVDPEQIEMVYWFAEDPAKPVRLPYSQRQFELDDDELTGLAREMASLDEFALTDDTTRCRYCPFRSLCDRGELPGEFDEFVSDWEGEELAERTIDYDQIEEIAF